jgi:HEAT repeat protein
MSDLYEPSAEFLKLLGAEALPLSGSIFADTNLQRLIELTGDSDTSNRDWATFYLSNTGIDTAEVRAALHRCLSDPRKAVQEEAMVGLATRGDMSVLPLLEKWLKGGLLSTMILEAAAAFAKPSLCPRLGELRDWADELELSQLWSEAWTECGCAAAVPQEPHG